MKTSIVIPTNRSDLRSIGNIFQLSGLDPDSFEVVVRDNSESELKRNLLSHLDPDLFKCNCVKLCSVGENFTSALKLASGDNVLFMGDDDCVFHGGLKKTHEMSNDPAFDGYKIFTGSYLVLSKGKAKIFKHPSFDNQKASLRLKNLINIVGTPNLLFYSVLNREYCHKIHDFMWSLPFRFSYTDQLMTLMYLTGSRVAQCEELMYVYDTSEWDCESDGIKKDRSIYKEEGIDPEIDILHYLMQALEGALFLRSNTAQEMAKEKLTDIANYWFRSKYMFFARFSRPSIENTETYNASIALKNKLLSRSELNIYDLLKEVSNIISISDPVAASKFYSFWKEY